MTPRIVHVLWSLRIGGAERAVFQLIAEQRRNGLVADAAIAADAGLYGRFVRETGATVHELHQRHARDVSAILRARTVFRAYDIVHFHSAEPMLIAAAATVPARRYYTHRAGAFHYPWKQALRYRTAGAIFRRAFTRLSANTRHAAGAASRLFRIPEADIPTTYNGIDFELLKATRTRDSVEAELDAPTGAFRIATTANLRAIKRVDLLVAAVALMGEPDVRCYVIGDGPDRDHLEALAASRGIGDRVIFLGTRENVIDYLQVMDAFVLPTGPEESFGNAAVEAMASQLPVVVFSDGGGLLEHVEDSVTGLVVKDVSGLAMALSALRANETLRRDLGRAASAFVRRRYSLQHMYSAYEALYAA